METRNLTEVLVNQINSRKFRAKPEHERLTILDTLGSVKSMCAAISDTIKVEEIGTSTDEVSELLKNADLEDSVKFDLLRATVADLVKAAIARKSGPSKEKPDALGFLHIAPLTADFSKTFERIIKSHTTFDPAQVTCAADIPKDLRHKFMFSAFLERTSGNKKEAEMMMDSEKCRKAASLALAQHLPNFAGVKSFFAWVKGGTSEASGTKRKDDWMDGL